MRKLDRNRVPTPPCLSKYVAGTDKWDDVTGRDKQQIRDTLEHMQDSLCAYCEGVLFGPAHIEHFRRRRDFPNVMFDWSNLFLSCNWEEHCGKYKDRQGAPHYYPQDLIKPDQDDPDDFLYFHSSGEVRPRSGVSSAWNSRAEETIKVLNLNHGRLFAARRSKASIYLSKEPDILEFLESLPESDRKDFIDEEIRSTAHEPYSAVIRHFFEKVS